MKTVIIDDEPKAIKTIESLLQILFPKLAIVGTADTVATGLLQIEMKKPDLVFLDIQLPDGTGFQLLDKLTGRKPVIIFTTAYQEFGHVAFRYDAVDYLLKPIDPEDLKNAVHRSLRRMENSRKELESIDDVDQENSGTKITIAQKNTTSTIRLDEIIRLQGEGSYTTLILYSGEKLVASKGLKSIEELLPTTNFLRIHQSHVVNLKFIKASKLTGSKPSIIMEDDMEISIAARRKDCIPTIEQWLK